ncbi:MAG: hypothetical protein AAGA25_09490 [Planctomycetota bacterium]
METPPKATPPKNAPMAHDPHEADMDSELSSFFSDVKYVYDKFGTQVIGGLAIAAIVFAGYNLLSKNREAALQNAWLDLYGSTTPESLEVTAEGNKNPAVRAKAHLNAGDLLLAESRTATEEDAPAILTSAAGHYQAALDEAPHLIFELNALDGLATIAESQYDTAKAGDLYNEIKTKAEGEFPYWVNLADSRLALLPQLTEAVEFAAEPVVEESTSESSAAPTVGGVDLTTPFELAPETTEASAEAEPAAEAEAEPAAAE